MKKQNYISICLIFTAIFVCGCASIEKARNLGNSNAEDAARETLGLKKTGITECDETIEILSRKSKGNANTVEDSWTQRAMIELLKQQIYDYVNKDGAKRTAQEKVDLTQKCQTALGFLKDQPKK